MIQVAHCGAGFVDLVLVNQDLCQNCCVQIHIFNDADFPRQFEDLAELFEISVMADGTLAAWRQSLAPPHTGSYVSRY